MQLKTLSITNFLGIGEGKLTFDKSGLTLIEGINNDSPSATSNGAGKSSIAEALFWVLFGKTRRGLTGDDVINEMAGKDCRVALCFDDYILTRYRKAGKEKASGLMLEQTTKGDIIDLTKGTTKETQALLEDIIKMSELTFSKVAYFGQADIKSFASLTDAELKQVFEQALGLTCFGKYFDNAKKYKGALEGEIMTAKGEMENLQREKVFVEEKIELLKKQVAELISRRKSELAMLAEREAEVDAELKFCEAKVRAATETHEASDEEIEELNKARVKLFELNKLKERLAQEYKDESEKLTGAKAQAGLKLVEIKKREAELNNIMAKVGKPCSECAKEIKIEDVKAVAEQLKKAIENLRAEASVISIDHCEPLEKRVAGLLALFAPLEEKIESFGKPDVELAKIEERKKAGEREKTEAKARLELLSANKKKIADAIALLKTELEKPAEKDLTKKEEALLGEIKSKLAALVARLEELQAELEGAEMLVEIMGNGGLKSYIFDSVTPELNRVIGEYMAIMNSDIDVEISTVSKLKSGDLKEKFEIKVSNKNGASSFAGSSGGERQLINLAIALGFNTICRAISEGNVNTLFLDEPLENLDEANSESAVELLQKFVEKIPNVFIIAHNPAVKDLVSSAITITKKDGRAQLAA